METAASLLSRRLFIKSYLSYIALSGDDYLDLLYNKACYKLAEGVQVDRMADKNLSEILNYTSW